MVLGPLFALLYVKVPAVARSTVLSGLLFGVMVMLVMIFIVVPLGHAQAASRNPHALLNTFVAHSVFFGLPVALVVRRSLRAPSS